MANKVRVFPTLCTADVLWERQLITLASALATGFAPTTSLPAPVPWVRTCYGTAQGILKMQPAPSNGAGDTSSGGYIIVVIVIKEAQ